MNPAQAAKFANARYNIGIQSTYHARVERVVFDTITEIIFHIIQLLTEIKSDEFFKF